ncbi:hypothetical protein DAPPUDRAFT_272012 [Daphnia pulex]|uniref:Uncharacterized protein n=1 Tax=Daphnia pulex TaxID=6669 RepID=E9I2N7_DAPPU|nr:hypothetical protein DAPPUDRAFT_272012 [Daphnia pulex]|eukprot:EFX61743.1 hypothetical protein DAPPUDRAFT_272012 [Daphnia pulex]
MDGAAANEMGPQAPFLLIQDYDASCDASLGIDSRNFPVKRSSRASFPGAKASGSAVRKSKDGSTKAITALRLCFVILW